VCIDSRVRDCSPLSDCGPLALAHWCNDPSVTCTDGVASWCPGGAREILDYKALFGSPNA
jgi:hypothetical protein